MALDELSELRTTQRPIRTVTQLTYPRQGAPVEQFYCDKGPSFYLPKDNNLRDRVPANVSERLAPHVRDSLTQQCFTTLPHVGALTNNAQSSSKSTDALYEARHHQQMEEKSELVSTFLRALTAAAPSPPQHSSGCLPSMPCYATGQQQQKSDGNILPRRGEPQRIVSCPPDPPSLPILASHNMLPSVPASTSTVTAVSEGNALIVPDGTARRGRDTSSAVDEHIRLNASWHHGDVMKPPPNVSCENPVAETPQDPIRLDDIWELPFPLPSQNNLHSHLSHYTTNPFIPPVDCDTKTEVDSCFSKAMHSSEGRLPRALTYCTTNGVDTDDQHEFRSRQTRATLEGRLTELETSTMQSPRRSANEKLETLFQVLPLSSPAQLCALRPDNRNEKHASRLFGVCWNTIQTESEEGKRIEQRPDGKAEPQSPTAVQRQPKDDNTGLVIQRQLCGADCYSNTKDRPRSRPSVEDVVLSKNERPLDNAEKVSAFIAALHAFLASGDLYADVDSELNTGLIAAETSVRPYANLRESHHDMAVAGQELTKPEIFPAPTSREAHDPCGIREDEQTERVVHGTKPNDTALVAFGSANDILGRPTYPSAACSDRTSYCSGITALGSEMSSYAGTNFDRSVSYTSCSSLGTGGYSSVATIMQDPSCTVEPTEVEKVDSSAYIFNQPSHTLTASSIEGILVAQPEKNCPATAATTTTVNEASRFQKLMKAFYAEDSRHSVLWAESDRCLPPYGSPGQDQLNAQRKPWKAAAGIHEVTHQVKALVKRLRGLQLITREMASIPDASRDALCCCLSGDLIPDTTKPEEAATSASTKWKFEHLLVLSVKMNGSSNGAQGKHVEPPAVRPAELSGASVAAPFDFQIQDEVFVVSPVQGLQASSTQALTLMSFAESVKQQRRSDTASDVGRNTNGYPLRSLSSTFAEGSSRHLLWRGWIALLNWQEQRRLGEWENLISGVHHVRNDLRGSCQDVKESASQQLFNSASAGSRATPTGNERNGPVNRTVDYSEVILGERTESTTPTTFLGEQVGYHTTCKTESSCPSEPGHHRADHLGTHKATFGTWAPDRGSEVARRNGGQIVNALSGYTSTATNGVLRNTKLARITTNGQSGQVTDLHCHETVELLSKQRFQEPAASSLCSDTHLKQTATQSEPESGSPSAKRLTTLPTSAALSEVAQVTSNQLVTALLQCLQNFDVADDISQLKHEGGFFSTVSSWAGTTATVAAPRSHHSASTLREGCELLQLNDPPPKLSPTVEWQPRKASRERLPSSDTVETRIPPRSSTSGKHGARNRYWGGESLEVEVCRERASRQVSPRVVVDGGKEKLESNSGFEENSHCMGFFREHRTVFISWVPRAARADNVKQKASMEMRLKILLQMAMGVRGIVRVGLFPPRGSHCCVLFENPAAASAFIKEYGGPTYTSTTEQFKADICAAYAVALDRGIERVFIRIEEFKPHILQQHLLQQAKDRSSPPLREWHDRRRDCVSTSHQFTGGKRRQQHMVGLRDRRQPNSGSSIQSFRNAPAPHDNWTFTQPTNGPSSVQLPPWQMREHSSESCLAGRPQLRPDAPQLLENASPCSNRAHHRDR